MLREALSSPAPGPPAAGPAARTIDEDDEAAAAAAAAAAVGLVAADREAPEDGV